MNANYPIAPLSKAIDYKSDFAEIDDFQTYKRCRVQLHAQGIVERDALLGAQIKTKEQQICRANDFLVAEIDAKLGGFGIVPESLDGAIVSSHYFLFTINENVLNKRFLEFFIRTPAFIDQVQAKGSTNYAAIRPSDVLSYEIPLPLLEEQQRIVARIEEFTPKIEEARELRREAIEEAETIISRVISNLSFDKRHWTTIRASILDKKGSVRSGPFGSQLHHDEFVEAGVAAIGTRDVQVHRFILNSGWYVTHHKFEQFKRYQVFPGDVLGTIVGASIGRFCVVPESVPLAFTTKHVIALTLDHSKALSEFISYLLNFHTRCRTSLFVQSEGSAQPSLNSTKILETEIPLPDIPEQKRIVAYLDDLQAKVDTLRRLQAETAAELNALLPSVLDKAFKGEL